MKFVLDASMALAWLFKREKANEADCADRALLAIEHAEALVPQLWHIEIANALLVGQSRAERLLVRDRPVAAILSQGRLPVIAQVVRK